ncbi:hypothetical protein [Tautonia plasticadhaerens]|uniref:Uncharacterized protein n=1 Tax=Tautonia plasticadhaerens TaxID=2527974 RepID=A0A518H4J8_9BACT|nr:hypothetical protein [Tautonia plasticadhaerens]QDV35763.1 hypothetical protein ElP_36690 [Tautonia plasticadhaerens]
MKRLIKSSIKKVWGLTDVVRRPVRRKLDALLGGTIRDPIAQHLHALNVSHHEMNISLNSCVREIARLEMQVEQLRIQLAEGRAGAEGIGATAEAA